MWINKAEYEALKKESDNNLRDADMFRQLVHAIKENKTIMYKDFVILSRDVWDELTNKFHSEEDEIKDIKAELEWYKIKYYEMKRST